MKSAIIKFLKRFQKKPFNPKSSGLLDLTINIYSLEKKIDALQNTNALIIQALYELIAVNQKLAQLHPSLEGEGKEAPAADQLPKA